MKINPTLALGLLLCTRLLCSAAEPAPGRNLYAEIYAIRNSYENNRLGAYHPYGLIYALASDTVGEDRDYQTRKGEALKVREFNLRNGKRPRPLVLRMNVGDTLTVKFTNHISRVPFNIASSYASIHASGVGLKKSILSDGSWVGKNTNFPRAEIWPGGTTYYRWTAVAEGVFLIYSQASNIGPGNFTAGQLAEGLFGAIIVEPPGAEYYRSQVTAEALALATKDGIIDYQAVYPAGYRYPGDKNGEDRGGTPILNMLKPCNRTDPETKKKYDYEFVHTDLTALITGPQAGDFPTDSTGPSFEQNPSYPERWKPWREFSIFYHDDGVNTQAFGNVCPGNLEENEQYPSDTDSDNFAINYGIAGIVPIIFANRIGVGPQGQAVTAKFEEFFLSSWACGDPAMPVDIPANNKERARATYAKFPDDPSNVYHSYMNDHVKFRILHAGSNLTHVHHLHAHQWLRTAASDQSHYLDSQVITPGATNTLDIVYGGSGNKNKTVGDSIFHCHFYPHFAGGMWALWRVHDVFEEGTPLLKGDEWPKIDVNANGGWVRALPDGGIETGTPIPAIVPVPTIALAPKPAKVKLIEALAPDAKNPSRMVRVGQVAQVDDNDLDEMLNPGFPFFIPGVGGQRAPHPPLDFALDKGKPIDGGLPRHLVLSADNIYEQHSQADFTKEIGQAETTEDGRPTGKFIHGKATAVQLPEGGTKAEWVAMQNHATRFHDTKFPNGTQAQGDQRFTLNGLPPALGAPFADPYITSDGKVPEPQLPVRRYKAAAVQLDVVFNKKGWHYPQQRILTLWDDVKPTLQNARSPEPLFFRANSGEVVEFWHTNLVPNYYEWDNFQIRTPTDVIGQHIHLVKFDVTASDGAANGFNYEDGTFSPEEVRGLIKVINNRGGLYTPPGSDYAAWLPNQPSTYQWPVPAGAWTTKAPPLLYAATHPVLGDGKDVYQEWEGAQTTIQRWYADPVLDKTGNDRTLRTVFTHDHFGPSTHQQAGLYAGLLVEPAGSKWLSNTEELELSKGRDDGGPTSWQARIIDEKNPANSFREFALEFGDNQLTYLPWSKAKSDLYKYYKSGSFGPTVPPTEYKGWRKEGLAGDEEVKWAAGVNVKGTTVANPSGTTSIFSQTFHEGSYVVNYRSEPMPFRVNASKDESVAPNRTKNPQVSLANAYASIKRFDEDLNKQPPLGEPIARIIGGVAPPSLVNNFVYPGPFAGAGPFDPYTPLLRAYQGEKVQVRTLVGSQLLPHSFMITGLNWLYEPDYGNSGYLGAQTMGISEHFEMEFRLPADKRDTIDYLYRASSGQDGFEAGSWGLLRSYAANKPQADLPALPGSPEIKYPEIAGNTTKFKVWAVRVVKANTKLEDGYTVVKAGTVVNPNDGTKPLDQMMIYMLEDDLDITRTALAPDVISRVERKLGTVLEPLILRCAAGDIVEVELFNYITNYGSESGRWMKDGVFFVDPQQQQITSPYPVTIPLVPGTVGLDVQMLAPLNRPGFNVAGVNVGANNVTNGALAPDQLVPAILGPLDGVVGGQKVSSRKYAWYAGKIDQQAGKVVPVEFGAVNILPADHYQQQSKGLIGAIIVEPAGSTFRLDTQQGSNVPITRASATILSADGTTLFREFVAVFEDDNTVLGGSNINYSSDPLAARLNTAPDDFSAPDVHRVLSNTQLNPPNDPLTPVFAAAKGSPVRLRLLHPGGLGNDMCIALHGHVWQEEPWLENSTILGNNAASNWQGSHDRFGPNSAFNLLLGEETGGAGGVNGILGDYLLRDFMTASYKGGAWGIVRVGKPNKAVVSIMDYPGAFTTVVDKPGAEGATATTFRSANRPVPEPGEQFPLAGRITVDLATGVLAPTVTVTVKVDGAPDVKIPAAVPVKRDGRWSTKISVAKYPATIVVEADSPSGGSDSVDIKAPAEVKSQALLRERPESDAQRAEQEMATELSLQAVVPPKAPIKAENLMRRLRTEK